MAEPASAFSIDDEDQVHAAGNGAVTSGRRLLRRPTTAETERIARGCAPAGLTIPVLMAAIGRDTGCSRATAYRAVEDAFADGTLAQTEAQDR
jgi:hypothetical protein